MDGSDPRPAGLMIRVLSPVALTNPGTIRLDRDETHHLKVRRVPLGSLVEVLDGQGGVGRGALEGPGLVRVDDIRIEGPPPELTLWVGAGDKERFGWLVEKCVELGVTRLVPMETSRTQSVDTRLRESHLEKLERRADEALKQCGGAWRMAITAPERLSALVANPPDGARWVADIDGNSPVFDPAEGMTVAIGPEGGFAEDEIQRLVDAGFQKVKLATRILRFETAAVAAAVLANARRGNSR